MCTGIIRWSSCLRPLAVTAAVLSALGALASPASAATLPAAFGPPLEKFVQDQSRPTQTAVGDFNQDGHLDIVGVSVNGQPLDQPNDIALMQGDGSGNFSAPTGISTTDGLNRIVVGQFNGDTDPDLAVSLTFSGQILIFTGAAGMTFNAGPQISMSGAGSTPFGIAVGEFNGDSDPDLAVADNAGNQVEILTGTGPSAAWLPILGRRRTTSSGSAADHPSRLSAGRVRRRAATTTRPRSLGTSRLAAS